MKFETGKNRLPGRPRVKAADQDTREAAIEAARGLLLEGGDGLFSMENVARTLNLRTPSLYHHFPGGRDEMVLAVADRCSLIDGAAIAAIIAAGGEPVERLSRIARHFAAGASHHPYHMLTELRKRLPEPARATLQGLFALRVEAPLLALIREAQASGHFRKLEPELVVRGFLTLMLSLGEFEANDPQRAGLPDFLVDLLVEGLRQRSSK